MKVILVRHGQTEWNKRDIFRGRKDIPLDESGKRQALLTAKSLAQMDLSVKAIYTSPLQRAVETAKNIATISNKKCYIITIFCIFYITLVVNYQ